MATDLDFFAGTETVEQADTPTKETAASPIPDDGGDAAATDVLSEISSVLMPQKEEEDAPEAKSETKVETAPKEDAKPKTVLSNPYQHSSRALLLADSWGISADEAARYPSEESLLLAVSQRENRKLRESVQQRTTGKKEEARPDDGFVIPEEIPFDESDDPKIKAVYQQNRATLLQLKEHTDKIVQAKNAEIEALTAEHEHAAERDAQETQAMIVQAFDEEVASWGPEFAELIGVPSQTLRETGNPQSAEAKKVNDYVSQRQFGYAAFHGTPSRNEQIRLTRQFVREAKGALFQEMAQKTARSEIANGLKKQKGGVGLRPGRARDSGPVPQGDAAAKSAIGDYYAAHGLDPWARKTA